MKLQSRRAFLGQAGRTAAAATAVTAGGLVLIRNHAIAADLKVLALYEEWSEAFRDKHAFFPPANPEDIDADFVRRWHAKCDRVKDLERRIAETPAATVEGVMAKLRVISRPVPRGPVGNPLAASALTDLERLALQGGAS